MPVLTGVMYLLAWIPGAQDALGDDYARGGVAEREGIRQFFTLDQSDFAVYRLYGKIRHLLIPL